MLTGSCKQTIKPVSMRKGVRVEQRHPMHILRIPNSDIVGFRKSEVFTKAQKLNIRIACFKIIHRSIHTSVVGHNNVLRTPGLGIQCFQAASQILSTIEVNNDDANPV